MHAQALGRVEDPPAAEALLKRIIAPIMPRILFSPAPTTAGDARLLDEVLRKSADADNRMDDGLPP